MSGQSGPLLFRRFQVDDAQQVSELFAQVYGPRYVYPEVYLPSVIARKNAGGCWYSVVVEQDGRIVGHAALMSAVPDAWCAELALMVVSPGAIGRGIGLRLARMLCNHATQAGIGMVFAMLVISHSQTQRMAAPLGFFTTGLLLDYLPSPFVGGGRESYVLSCLALKARPLPDINWPAGASPWIADVLAQLGTYPVAMPPADAGIGIGSALAPLEVRCDGELIVLTMPDADGHALAEAVRLPPQRRRLVRLGISDALDAATSQLCRAGYRHVGLIPDVDGGWRWLMQAGFSTDPLPLHCAQAARIFACAHAHGPHA
jgi:GNAT superfamily N-acetyltransferase